MLAWTLVAPTGSTQLLVTNLTGHPAVIVPNALRGEDAPVPQVRENGDLEHGGPGTPVSLHLSWTALCRSEAAGVG